MDNFMVIGLVMALGLVATAVAAVVTSERVKDFFRS